VPLLVPCADDMPMRSTPDAVAAFRSWIDSTAVFAALAESASGTCSLTFESAE
jgi:hypothetical protein